MCKQESLPSWTEDLVGDQPDACSDRPMAKLAVTALCLRHPTASPADESAEHRIDRKGDRGRNFYREDVSFRKERNGFNPLSSNRIQGRE